MYELSKNVLEKVSFSKTLFQKELTKAIKWINADEKTQLKEWCQQMFGKQYENEIMEAFEKDINFFTAN